MFFFLFFFFVFFFCCCFFFGGGGGVVVVVFCCCFFLFCFFFFFFLFCFVSVVLCSLLFEHSKFIFNPSKYPCKKNKSQKGLPLETKNTQNHENRRLGLIESLHTQLQPVQSV